MKEWFNRQTPSVRAMLTVGGWVNAIIGVILLMTFAPPYIIVTAVITAIVLCTIGLIYCLYNLVRMEYEWKDRERGGHWR